MKKSNINHPKHYNACGEPDDEGSVPFEPIKVIEGFGLSWGFCLGCAVKYILRAPFKGSEREDLEKALWYLDRLASRIGQKRVRCYHSDVARAWKLDSRLENVVMRISCGQPRPAANELREYLEARFR